MVRPSLPRILDQIGRASIGARPAQNWHLQVWHLSARMAQKVAGSTEKQSL
jgi:hypothetical protein